MNIVVPVKQVPDLVEELLIAEDGTRLDSEGLQLKLNEFDEHAIEEALLLKEAHGGKVTVLTMDAGGVDEALFAALAKGADQAIKVTGNFDEGMDTHVAAAVLGEVIKRMPYDLILTGVQAATDRDGQLGPLLACALNLPHVSVVTGVQLTGEMVTVNQEYAGGLVAEMEIKLPALLGIQAAGKPPRYVPVSKVRQAARTAKIEEVEAPSVSAAASTSVRRMFKPESGTRAEMIEGSPEEQVDRLLAVFRERGFLK